MNVVVHFHPGWPFRSGTVLESLIDDGVYRSQWVTGTSNGGLTAYVGGDRWLWENTLFNGQFDDADPLERPIYGAWNRHADPYGAAPRFGSAYLRLRADIPQRATFCWPDSAMGATTVVDVEGLPALCTRADAEVPDDPLNDYVEAHIHGGVALARDVDAIVVDPSDADVLPTTLARLDIPVEVHDGYCASAEDLDASYRGEVPVELARRLGGIITPARLAAAARSGEHDPQAVKWLWHCLARFGRVDMPSSGREASPIDVTPFGNGR